MKKSHIECIKSSMKYGGMISGCAFEQLQLTFPFRPRASPANLWGAAVGFPVSVRKREKWGEFLQVWGEKGTGCSSLMLSIHTVLAKLNSVGDKSDLGRRLCGSPEFDTKPGEIEPNCPICMALQARQDARGIDLICVYNRYWLWSLKLLAPFGWWGPNIQNEGCVCNLGTRDITNGNLQDQRKSKKQAPLREKVC